METLSIILIIVCIIVSLTVLILLLSLGTVDPLNYGITLNSISKAIGTKAYNNGRYLIGPFDSFIQYPSRSVTVEFSDSKTADVIIKLFKNYLLLNKVRTITNQNKRRFSIRTLRILPV
jgi:hypothetical protein